jgi:hypothetical protein
MLGKGRPRAVVPLVARQVAVDRHRQPVRQVQLVEPVVEVGRAFDQHERRAQRADALGHQPRAGGAVVAHADDVGLLHRRVVQGSRWRAS